ncbi:MAG: LexA family protein [Plesiomonas sp.]|uniref:LexA family protein n=1 Tax=Plesiomonas sp. TaxID=2486279 RepID=UPI003F3D6907
MLQAGIHSGDLLVVDRAVTATQSAIVLACLDGEFTVKYQQTHPHPALVPANPDFPAIYLNQRQ